MKSELFNDLISLKDASVQWKIDDSVLRHAIVSGKLVENVDVKKFGKQWVITRTAMERVYGYIPKNSDEIYSKRKLQAAIMYVSKIALDYSKQEKISITEACERFEKHNISQLIIDCFDYYEHCNFAEILEEISSKIKKGYIYDRN